MKLIKLTSEQVITIYHEHMKQDFPPDELKPLNMILRAVEAGRYECLGLVADEILGYTFLVKLGEDYLIDYLAVLDGRRNQGLGAEILRLLGGYLKGARSIIGEVEDPAFGTTAEERTLRTRRFGFYMRNGFRDTGVKATCFGVPFLIIETGEGLLHDPEEIRRLYRAHYKAVLPPAMYEKNVVI